MRASIRMDTCDTANASQDAGLSNAVSIEPKFNNGRYLWSMTSESYIYVTFFQITALLVQRHCNANNGRPSINTETCDTEYESPVSCLSNAILNTSHTLILIREA
jgi:hypothetical protein